VVRGYRNVCKIPGGHKTDLDPKDQVSPSLGI
jgi:hypothetical protein